MAEIRRELNFDKFAEITDEQIDTYRHDHRSAKVVGEYETALNRYRERLDDLKVVDPACGSGAFLVGAIDRLALAVATERIGGSKPTEDALQRARRDVLRGCIYGVDKDRFAAELCKVALWIHCAVPDLPLSFLDHRIQHGDSLVGWPLLEIPP